MLASLSSAIPIDDPERIEESMESVARRVDTDWLQEHLKVQRQSRMSPPAFRYQLSERARSANKRIVLRSEEHTSELQSRPHLVCRLLLEKKKTHRLAYRTI